MSDLDLAALVELAEAYKPDRKDGLDGMRLDILRRKVLDFAAALSSPETTPAGVLDDDDEPTQPTPGMSWHTAQCVICGEWFTTHGTAHPGSPMSLDVDALFEAMWKVSSFDPASQYVDVKRREVREFTETVVREYDRLALPQPGEPG